MPYPILTLPYPFSKRLYQLLSPLELQRLQTAAGYDIHDLQPLVTTHTVDSFYAYSWKHVPAPPFTIVIKVPGKEQIALPNVDHVVNCRYETNLWYMSSSTFKNLKTRMVGTPQANFIYCDITNDFLQQASKVVETSVVNIILSKVKEDVNFLSVTQMFPKVKSILFNYYADPEKRIENNYLFGRDYLYFAFCRFEEFYCFKPEELFDFINKRSAKFCLYVDQKVLERINSAYYLKKVEPFFDNRFDKAVHGYPKICICIPGTDQAWKWYMKK